MWPFDRLRPARFRYEGFGGIAELAWPRALVYVDRARARSLGFRDGGERWREPEPASPFATVLSAPLEAHLQITNRCASGCRGCYTAATPAGLRDEWGLEDWKHALDELAARGVFHVALGGGESAQLEWLGDLAAHARRRGIVPNLTTSGLAAVERLAGWAARFGQINVSLDGTGATYAAVRGHDGFSRADRAVVALRRATRHVGLNCVLTRQSFPELESLFRYAASRRVAEIELLRFKPTGRGRAAHDELRLDDRQHRELLPTILRLARRYRRRVRLDCSFTPMVVHHGPPLRLVRWLALYGCAGGDLLVAARANGALMACSFDDDAAPASLTELDAYWRGADAFPAFRGWRAAREPCRSCEYLELCRGGCRVVSRHVVGDAGAPDPECPRVLAAARAPRALASGERAAPGDGGAWRPPIAGPTASPRSERIDA